MKMKDGKANYESRPAHSTETIETKTESGFVGNSLIRGKEDYSSKEKKSTALSSKETKHETELLSKNEAKEEIKGKINFEKKSSTSLSVPQQDTSHVNTNIEKPKLEMEKEVKARPIDIKPVSSYPAITNTTVTSSKPV